MVQPSLGKGRFAVGGPWRSSMCRNIKTLFNFEPPATEDEIRASALQFVRKLSGFGRPSQANPAVFDRAGVELRLMLLSPASCSSPPLGGEGRRGGFEEA